MSVREELKVRDIATMLAPVLEGQPIREVVRADGGITNTVYRVTAASGDIFALRIYAAGGSAVDREARLLAQIGGSLPVPRPLLAATLHRHPHLAYRWIDGLTLNQFRRKYPEALDAVATPLGATMARIANTFRRTDASRPPGETPSIADRVTAADTRLEEPLVRRRLGDALADRMRRLFVSRAEALKALDREFGLVHGDFGGRNVIVRQSADGEWEVSGILDWETAELGSGLWDVGSLFRYARRYGASFRDGFERGYRAERGTLPQDWWRLARLLDATRLVELSADERELPELFADCRTLLESLADESVDRPDRVADAGGTPLDAHAQLRATIDLAAAAQRRGDGPFAARIVGADGQLLAEAANAVRSTGDPTAHAEIVALRSLGRRAAPGALAGATMYVSAEPCAMCAGAIAWSGIARVVYAIDRARLRALDDAVPTEPGVTGRELLERSGRAVEQVESLAGEAAFRLFPNAARGAPA